MAASAAWKQSVRRGRLVGDERTQQTLAIENRRQQTFIELSMSRRPIDWRNVSVARIDRESDDVQSFYLIDENMEPLPSFLPGQHLLLERPSLGELPKDSRCYSLSDDSTGGHWRISVKKNSNYPGSVSRWLHEEVSVGDVLRVRGPSGAFYMQSDPDSNLVLLSAGIGITPMIPMLMSAIRRNFKSVYCFAQFRDTNHMPFADSLFNLKQQYPQLDISVWISRFPKGVRRSPSSIFREGKYTVGDIKNAIEERGRTSSTTDFYLCGPEAWQTSTTSQLIAEGFEEERVRYELFQESEKPVKQEEASSPRRIVFAQSGRSADFDSSHPSLLGCASKNQVALSSGCRTGACGACAIRLLQGKVKYTRKPQFQLKSNEILPCVCVPEEDIVVDA